MKKLYRALVPVRFREKVKTYQEYQGYQKLRQQEGHVYQQFDATQSIFVHIPKAGGISIIKSLYGETAGGFGHPTYRRFLKLYGNRRFNTYYKFTFVRNPWDRLYSAYSFLKKGGMNHLDAQFSKEVMTEVDTFEDFVMHWLTPERMNSWIHFIPQFTFITNDSNKIMVDFVGRFENFQEDFTTISKHIGVNQPLIHLNKTKDKKQHSYRDAYTNEMKSRVAELYKTDIELFKYNF
ncbi:sulfotransferase family 2 domain-containing protein [Psychroserpens algicola]|uniref:Sulfotransferase family protein n=1 Tax=Psychroserpens algicola TaxID=1719034 RepID=A0ABT0H9P9_9FLAO|nr:sulfotransferase family 2 domain-containing protein [Psychroserpens algicola]MCK8480550.1 sulfotransferase family protein [Psychroserpens algicola]